MCDTMMVSLWVWAVLLWIEGIERDKIVWLIVAGLLVAASALTKYFGMCLIPLLALQALARKRRPGLWIACIALPVLILVGYQAWTKGLYGRGLLSDAAAYARDSNERKGILTWAKAGLIGLSFTGGCVLPILFCAPWIWRRVPPALGLVMGALVGTAAVAFSAGKLNDVLNPIPSTGFVLGGVQFGLFAAGGLTVMALAVVEVWRHRNGEPCLLSIWIVGTFAFASFVNWSINGRSILPMVPAATILLARHFDDPPDAPARRSAPILYALVLAAAVVALGVTWADARLARASRATVATIEKKMRGDSHTLWFQGHWGFQYYMERIGGRPFDVNKISLRSGDRVAIPDNNTNIWLPAISAIDTSEVVTFQSDGPPLLTTMRTELGAGFYSNVFGPLPFSFGHSPREGCSLVRFKTSRKP
jgi:4-amino-4-deoxy-L-arabinose transferase-like glycosyltransferase